MVEPDKLLEERDALRAEVEELARTKDWLYANWQTAEHQLQEIHSSKMWRIWMFYIRLRCIVLWPFVAIFALPKSIAASGRRGLGWCRLAISTLRLKRRAGTRRECGPLPVPDPESTLQSRTIRPRVLIAMPYHIHPPNHGGGVRLYNLVKLLCRTCDLYLLVFSIGGEDAAQREALEPYCVRVDFHRWIPQHRPDRFGLLPPSAQLFWSERAAARIRDLVLTHEIDIVQLEYTELGQYAKVVPDGVPVIITEHDIGFRTQTRRRRLRFMDRYPDSKAYSATGTDLWRLLVHEVETCCDADRLHMMSEVDGIHLGAYLPDGVERMRVAPNGVDCEALAPSGDGGTRKGVLYVGNFQNLPNMDALEYLVTDVWPILRLRCPDAKLTVVGAHAEGRVDHYHGRDGIEVVGEVPEITPYYHDHQVLAAPIRAGSGTRLKILEAFAAGIPVVSTSLGAEGIAYDDGQHLLIADDAVAFAVGLERVLNDGEFAAGLAAAGAAMAGERYGWPGIAATIEGDYAELLAVRKTERGPRPGGAPVEVHDPGPGGIRGPGGGSVLATVAIPTFRGGEKLAETLAAINDQETDFRFEILCVDSGSSDDDIRVMIERGARVYAIDGAHFDHGMTRDRLAELARGEIVVYLNQDAVPAHEQWLQAITGPLVDGGASIAAVQGAMREVDDPEQRFFWDSCGERFYFTSESNGWIERFQGVGFSTVNCAIHRNVLGRYPFGWAPMMEDKKWQRTITANGFQIAYSEQGLAIHTHDYDWNGLVERCRAEGYGWRLLQENYGFGEMLRDMVRPRVYLELMRGVVSGRVRSAAEFFFPILRPLNLYRGNHFSQRMEN